MSFSVLTTLIYRQEIEYLVTGVRVRDVQVFFEHRDELGDSTSEPVLERSRPSASIVSWDTMNAALLRTFVREKDVTCMLNHSIRHRSAVV